MRDLDWLSGRFLTCDIPKDKRFLLKYFSGPLGKAFVRYWLTFGNADNFVDHTGVWARPLTVWRMEQKMKILLWNHHHAKTTLSEDNLRVLSQIESGVFNLTEGRRRWKIAMS